MFIDKKAAEEFFSLAKKEEYNQNYQKAFEYYTKAIKIDHRNYYYYSHRASLCQQMQDYVGAVQDYTQTIRLNDDIDLMHNYFERGYIYYLAGNVKRAKKEFLSATQIYPIDSDVYDLQIKYLSMIGEYREAISICNKFIKLYPNQAEGYSKRANIYLTLKDFKQAIRDFSKAINIKPSNEYCYRDRGIARVAKGDYLEAITDFTKAIELKIYDSNIYCHRGDARYQIKDFTGAIQDYTKAIKQDSRNAHAYKNRGNAYCAANQKKLAIKDFIEAVCFFIRDYDFENYQKAFNLVIIHLTEADIRHHEYIKSNF